MDVDFAFICDYADASGKLNALGIGFDTIFAKQLPLRHPHFSLVLQLRTSLIEDGDKDIQIILIDDDGNDVIKPVHGHFHISRNDITAPSIGRFIMAFTNVEFKKYGNYSVRVVIENSEIASISFRVSKPSEKPQITGNA